MCAPTRQGTSQGTPGPLHLDSFLEHSCQGCADWEGSSRGWAQRANVFSLISNQPSEMAPQESRIWSLPPLPSGKGQDWCFCFPDHPGLPPPQPAPGMGLQTGLSARHRKPGEAGHLKTLMEKAWARVYTSPASAHPAKGEAVLLKASRPPSPWLPIPAWPLPMLRVEGFNLKL